MRRYDERAPKKTINLVKEFIVCLDQLRAISAVHSRKQVFFQSLMKDVESHNAQDQLSAEGIKIHNSKGITAVSRIEWALQIIRDEKGSIDSLIDDTTRALEAVSNRLIMNNWRCKSQALTILFNSCSSYAQSNRKSSRSPWTATTRP